MDPSAITVSGVINDPLIKGVILNRIYGTAMYTVLIWDWITTFNQERRLIWDMPWTPLKIIFLFQRYFSLVMFAIPIALYDHNWDSKTCKKLYLLDAYISMPMMLAGSLILLIRCYAIWQQNKIILYGGLGSLVIVAAAMATANAELSPLPIPEGLTAWACIATGRVGNEGWTSVGIWVCPLIYDLVVTVLSVYRVFVNHRDSSMSSVMRIFIRDGIVYFLLITAANSLNAGFFLQPKQGIKAINAIFCVVLISLLSQRLVLHLRQQVFDDVADTTVVEDSKQTRSSIPLPWRTRSCPHCGGLRKRTTIREFRPSTSFDTSSQYRSTNPMSDAVKIKLNADPEVGGPYPVSSENFETRVVDPDGYEYQPKEKPSTEAQEIASEWRRSRRPFRTPLRSNADHSNRRVSYWSDSAFATSCETPISEPPVPRLR